MLVLTKKLYLRDRACMDPLRGCQFLRLLAYLIDMDFSVTATRQNRFTVVSRFYAGYSQWRGPGHIRIRRVLHQQLQLFVSVLDQVEELARLRKERPDVTITPPSHNAFAVGHEVETIDQGKGQGRIGPHSRCLLILLPGHVLLAPKLDF